MNFEAVDLRPKGRTHTCVSGKNVPIRFSSYLFFLGKKKGKKKFTRMLMERHKNNRKMFGV